MTTRPQETVLGAGRGVNEEAARPEGRAARCDDGDGYSWWMPAGPLLKPPPFGIRRGDGSGAAPPVGPLANSPKAGMWFLLCSSAPLPCGPLLKSPDAGMCVSMEVGSELVSSAAGTVAATTTIEQSARIAHRVQRFIMVFLLAVARVERARRPFGHFR